MVWWFKAPTRIIAARTDCSSRCETEVQKCCRGLVRSASRMGAGSWVVEPRVGYSAATQVSRVTICAIFHGFRSNQKQIGQLVCRVTQQRVKRFDEFGSATTASLTVRFEFREGSNNNNRSLIEVGAPHTAEPQ
ncbi:hypothetical protein ACFX1X_022257 [Malus domestica]